MALRCLDLDSASRSLENGSNSKSQEHTTTADLMEAVHATKDPPVLAEKKHGRKTYYLMNWAEDARTGKESLPSWEPYRNVSTADRSKWKQEKQSGSVARLGGDHFLWHTGKAIKGTKRKRDTQDEANELPKDKKSAVSPDANKATNITQDTFQATQGGEWLGSEDSTVPERSPSRTMSREMTPVRCVIDISDDPEPVVVCDSASRSAHLISTESGVSNPDCDCSTEQVNCPVWAVEL